MAKIGISSTDLVWVFHERLRSIRRRLTGDAYRYRADARRRLDSTIGQNPESSLGDAR